MPLRSRTVVGVLLAWLAAAMIFGASGVLAELRPPGPQAVLLSLSLTLMLAIARVKPLLAWALSVDLHAMIAFHLTRFVGIYFLILCRQGVLPAAFALPAGWGDIAVATLALVIVVFRVQSRWLLRFWNGLGLLDILLVVATAARLGVHDPASMAAMVRLPLSLLITWLVPLIIVSHLLLLLRLGDGYRSSK